MKSFYPKFKLRFPAEKISLYANRYSLKEDESALAAGQRIAAGEFNRDNLTIIFDWKTKGRGRSRLSLNTDADIADTLRLAVAAKSERAAVAVLLGLSGVEVPVASAILTAVDQSRFTIIDFRALEAFDVPRTYQNRTIDLYLDYLQECRRLANDQGIDLRTLDRGLWQWSEEKSQKERISKRKGISST